LRSAELIGNVAVIVILAFVIFVVVSLVRAVRIVPQSQAYVVERLGRFQAVMKGGFHLLVPFVDRVAARIDLREQVANFPPQPVITADQAMVSIDSVIYFQITDPRSATYEVANFLQAIEQLTATTLRNLIGSLDLEQTQTSRESINKQLRGVLDEATAFADPENEAHIQRSVARLAEGKTLIVIAHRLSTIVSADNICVVDDGRIVAQGTHEELLERCPLYARMWSAHIGAGTWAAGSHGESSGGSPEELYGRSHGESHGESQREGDVR